MKPLLFLSNHSNPIATENVNNAKNVRSIHTFTLCKKIICFVNNQRNVQHEEKPGQIQGKQYSFRSSGINYKILQNLSILLNILFASTTQTERIRLFDYPRYC